MCVSSVFVFYPGFFCNLPEVMRLIVGGCAGTNINYMSCCLKHSDKIRPNDRGNTTQGTGKEQNIENTSKRHLNTPLRTLKVKVITKGEKYEYS